MEYAICEYCKKPFFRKNKLQKYHEKCKKFAIKENIKKYYNSDIIKDRQNYYSLIRRLNDKEKNYKKRIEIKYIRSLIDLKKVEPFFSITQIEEIEKNEEFHRDPFKKEIVNALKTKKAIEESEILNEKKIEILSKFSINELQEKLRNIISD